MKSLFIYIIWSLKFYDVEHYEETLERKSICLLGMIMFVCIDFQNKWTV